MDRRTFMLASAEAASAWMLTVSPAAAAPSPWESDWSGAAAPSIRLVAGGAQDVGDATRRAGLEFRLAPGFKTYWREPGDSGLPPAFDWSGSRNLAAADALWPAPRRFVEGGASSIGYEGPRLVLPLRVRALDPARPVTLALKLDYGVCEKLCIPAHGEARLVLPEGSGGPHRALLDGAEARVPALQPVGDGPPPRILDVTPVDGSPRRLLVRAAVPAGASAVDLFVEGPAGSAFGAPAIVSRVREGDRDLLFLDLRISGLPEASARIELRATLTADDAAVESEVELDWNAPSR